MVAIETLEIVASVVDDPPVDETEDDRALVKWARQDRAAFARLYSRYAERIYWYCYLRLGNRELAEDATSLTFTKALASLDTCRDDRFRPWLYRLASNVVTDHFRERRPETSLDAAWSLFDPTPTPEDHAIRHEGHDAARALLAHLPVNQRQIVELRLAGLTGAEIAKTLGRSHVWVRVNQLRAYAKLRDILEKDETHVWS